MWIELLQPVGEMKPGFHDVENEVTARAYIAAGLAKDAGDGPDKIILQRSMEHLRGTLSGFVRGMADEIRTSADAVRTAPRIEAGAAEADRTRGLGDFVRQVVFSGDGRGRDAQAAAVERLDKVYGSRYNAPQDRAAGQVEAVGSLGGFTTGAIFEGLLLKEMAENSVFASRCKMVPLGARTTFYPVLDQYRAPAPGQSAMFGGVQVFRKSETQQRTYTNAFFKQIALSATDLTALVPLSRDLIYDSTISIDGLVTELIGGALGWREEWEALNGLGNGQLLGIYNAPSTINVARNTAGAIKYQDVFTMRSRLLSACKAGAVWLIHPYTMPYIEQIQDPSGRFIMRPVPLTSGESSLGSKPVYQMEGIPILETEKAPAIGTPGDLTLTDPSRYLLGRRGGIEIGVSDQFLFDTDQIAIRAKLRDDGQPQLVKAITLADGASVVSCTVALQ